MKLCSIVPSWVTFRVICCPAVTVNSFGVKAKSVMVKLNFVEGPPFSQAETANMRIKMRIMKVLLFTISGSSSKFRQEAARSFHIFAVLIAELLDEIGFLLWCAHGHQDERDHSQ